MSSATGPGRGPACVPAAGRSSTGTTTIPTVDDTAAILCALHRADPERYRNAIERGVEWVLGMQCRNGGWGSFDADNTHYYLNNIPFADHGALLDPPTADLTARCISALAQLGFGRQHPAMARAPNICRAIRRPTARGSAAGAPTTFTAPGRCRALNAAGEDMGMYARRRSSG